MLGTSPLSSLLSSLSLSPRLSPGAANSDRLPSLSLIFSHSQPLTLGATRKSLPVHRPEKPALNAKARKCAAQQKKGSKKQKQAKKQLLENGGAPSPPPNVALKRTIRAAAVEYDSGLDESTVTPSGWGGNYTRSNIDKTVYSLDDLIGPHAKVKGMKLVPYRGP